MVVDSRLADTFEKGLALVAAEAMDRLAGRRQLRVPPAELATAAGQDVPEVLRLLPDETAVLTALVLRAYHGMSDAAEAAADSHAHQPPLRRWQAICRGVRGWALAHPDEYALIWGQPVPGYQAPPETMVAGARTVLALVQTLRDVLATGPVDDPDPQTPLSVGMAANVDALSSGLLAGLPDWMIARMLIGWTQLHGMLGFEVYGHIAGMAADPAAFFDFAAEQLGSFVGLPTR